MISLKLTLYRFLCDVNVFSGIFEYNEAGQYIPDTASFYCGWAPVSRHASSVNPATVNLSGTVEPTFFKSSGDGKDMALIFSHKQFDTTIDGSREVLTFTLKPTEFTGGDVPVIAKGTVDPTQYTGRPRKNYAIKLRDASGQVIGKLLFSLEAVEAATAQFSRHVSPPRKERESSPRQDATPPPRLPPQRGGSSSPRTPPQRAITAVRPSASPKRVEDARRLEIMIEQVSVKLDALDLDNPAPFLLGGGYTLKIKYDNYVFVSNVTCCHSPKQIVFPCEKASFDLLSVKEKIKFSLWENSKQVGGFSLDPEKFRVEVGNSKEYSIPFRYFPTNQFCSLDVTVYLWEGITRSSTGMKEEVSFLSSPFQQKCDELSNITQSDAAAQKRKTPPRQPSNSSPKQTSLTGPAVRTVPVVHSDPSKTVLRPRLPERPGVGDDAAAKRLDPHPAVSQPIFRPPAANAAPTRSANALPSRKEFLDHRRGQSPNPTRPAADLKTYTPATHPAQPAVLPTPEPTAPPKLSEVPLTDYKFPVFDPPSPSPSVSAEAKKVYTPLDTPHRDESVRRRSTPRRSCLEDTPPPKTETGKKRRSPPTQKQHSPHEDYINEVMKRLDKMDSQRKGRNTRSSLVNEWSSWKEERASSRNSSVNGGYSRDGSVCSSAMSRDNSVSSISSRRASSPLPTKSNVEHAQLTPFQPKVIPQSRDNSLTRRHVYTSH